MSARSFKLRAYLLDGCPFSFKFWLFVVEAGLSQQVEMVRCDPEAPGFQAVREKLAAGLGGKPSFPTVEIEPGRYMADSDALIEHFAAGAGVDSGRLPALAFYKETLFPQVVELHKLKSHKGT